MKTKGTRVRPGVLSGLMVFTILALPCARAQIGDAGRGEQLLTSQGCLFCHSVLGKGGRTAPDLGRRQLTRSSPSSLFALLWNHGPQMWEAMSSRGMKVPKLSEAGIADLLAYLHSLRFFDPPGDAGRGKGIFTSKGCVGCHSIEGAENTPGPPVPDWPAISDPVRWIEQMWNHSAVMQELMNERGVTWPRFELRQMVDLLVYVETLPNRRQRRPLPVRNGDESNGARAFDELHCSQCHSFGPDIEGKIDLLRSVRREGSLTALGVQMWNHRPEMEEAARELNMEFSSFSEGQMADLLAYVISRGYFSSPGDHDRGEDVFRRKGCPSCHGIPDSGAPELKSPDNTYSPFRITASAWNHGPKMKAAMDQKGDDWPTMSAGEIEDIAAYLNYGPQQ